MNEAETRAEHIYPGLKAAGWGVVEGSRVRREYLIAPGRIEGRGRRGKPLCADYVLEYRNTKQQHLKSMTIPRLMRRLFLLAPILLIGCANRNFLFHPIKSTFVSHSNPIADWKFAGDIKFRADEMHAYIEQGHYNKAITDDVENACNNLPTEGAEQRKEDIATGSRISGSSRTARGNTRLTSKYPTTRPTGITCLFTTGTTQG
jgi:hypothetical protein